MCGHDTDCNGATVGGLWGLQGGEIPRAWTDRWNGRVGLSLAGHDEVTLDRTRSAARSPLMKLSSVHMYPQSP